jgi:eukaryotic-like serine/threonine-protein kinase
MSRLLDTPAMEPDELSSIKATSTGKYRVLAELGAGGMAHVYLAVSQGLAGFSKLVVLKVVKRDLARVPEFREAFLREARLCARLNHPNVIAVNEVEVLDGLPVIVMEHLQGQPLSNILRRVLGKVPLSVHLRILLDSLNGLHYAHELTDFDHTPLRLVHRDFTPQNIFVTYDGSVKVLDFGLAQVTRQATHSTSDSLQGKLRYMAPEQITTAALDRRTDVFAAGVLLSELITERRFWSDLDDSTVVERLKSGNIPTPRRSMPNCPSELEQICATALAFDRRQRYQTVAEMQRDIEAYMAMHSERITSQEIGRRVAEWFAHERECAEQVIDATLLNDTYVSWSQITAAKPGEFASISPPPAAATVTVCDLPRKSISTTRKNAGRWLKLSGTVAGAVLLLGTVLWFPRGQPDKVPEPTTPPSVAAPVESKRVTLRITAFPADAAILIDGIAFTENPYIRSVVPDDNWHELRVEAPGHKSSQQQVQYTRNLELVVTLEAEASSAAPVAPRSGAPTGIKRVVAPTHPLKPTSNTNLSCSPPYTYDQHGVKRFKPECL